MAGKSVDLNKLKTEIDSRKKERGEIATAVQGGTLMAKDQFLNGLLTSLQSGRESESTNLIKLVENKTAVRLQENPTHTVTPTRQVAPATPTYVPQRQPMMDEGERDEQLYADLENRRKKTLAESMQEYLSVPPVGAPMSNQPVNPVNAYMQQSGVKTPMLNEAYLVENVNKIVNNYLSENLGPIFEEAIKSTIIEMYAVERIKQVINENRELIKGVVSETLKEIIAKNKASKTQQ